MKKKRNPIAKSLRIHGRKIQAPLKGKGSKYNRQAIKDTYKQESY